MATQRFLFSPLFGEDFHPLTSIFFRWGWFNHQLENYWIVEVTTIQGTNISPKNVILKMIFLFPRWDMLIPCRVQCTAFFGLKNDAPQNSEQKIFTKNRFLSRFPSSTFFFLNLRWKKTPEAHFPVVTANGMDGCNRFCFLIFQEFMHIWLVF